MMSFCFFLEEVDTRFAQTDGHFDLLFLESEFLWRREKIADNLDLANWFVSVSYFACHKFAFLYASTRPQRSELFVHAR